MSRPTSSILLAALLGACAHAPSTAPRHYPKLPAPGAPGPAATAAFTPAAELQPVTPACRASEPALANALDDDCDGRIDGVDGSPSLALAYPRGAEVTLALRREAQPERVLGGAPCDADAPFCTVRVGADALAGGPHELVARLAAGSPRSALVIAVQARGGAATYIAPPLPPEQTERVLGRIGAP